MGRPCFTFYLLPQIIQAVEDDPSDRDQFVNTAAVLALRPDTCFSPARIPQGLRFLIVWHCGVNCTLVVRHELDEITNRDDVPKSNERRTRQELIERQLHDRPPGLILRIRPKKVSRSPSFDALWRPVVIHAELQLEAARPVCPMNERLFVKKELSQQPCRHECVVFAASEGDTLLEVLECQKEEFISRHALTVFPSSVRELSRGVARRPVAVRHASPRLRGA